MSWDYTEHSKFDVHGFQLVDVTNTDPRSPHDDLIWVGYGGMEGRWLSADQASEVAQSIERVVASHRARHAAAAQVPA